MASPRPAGGRAVMQGRREPPDSLDFFPTPPWATRALLEHVIPDARGTCWEPATGEGHMAHVLAERFHRVWRTDVHDYGGLDRVGSFVGFGLDVIESPPLMPGWIITNPPFAEAERFADRCFLDAGEGFALLLRTAWLEGADRYERLFRVAPPAIVAPFVERVPMTKGRWDPEASTATAYAWFVWRREATPAEGRASRAWDASGARLRWIPPGCRKRLERPGDRARFASKVSVNTGDARG